MQRVLFGEEVFIQFFAYADNTASTSKIYERQQEKSECGNCENYPKSSCDYRELCGADRSNLNEGTEGLS